MSKLDSLAGVFEGGAGLDTITEEREARRGTFNDLKEAYKQTFGEAKNAPDYAASRGLYKMFSMAQLMTETSLERSEWMLQFGSEGAFEEALEESEQYISETASGRAAEVDLDWAEKIDLVKESLTFVPQKRQRVEFFVEDYLFTDPEGDANDYLDTRSAYATEPLPLYDSDVVFLPSMKKRATEESVRTPAKSKKKGHKTVHVATLPLPPYNKPVRLNSTVTKDTPFKDAWKAIVSEDVVAAQAALSETREYHKALAQHAAGCCQATAVVQAQKSVSIAEDHIVRAKKLNKDVQSFWRKFTKSKRGAKIRANRQAMEMRKKEDEEREAQRQKKKLNFLLTQTELYAHFIGNKLGEGAPVVQSDDISPEDREEMERATAATQQAIEATRQRTEAFDEDMRRRKAIATGTPLTAVAPKPTLIDDEGDAVMGESENTTTNTTSGEDGASASAELITGDPDMKYLQPRMFAGKLKVYQLKGLNWLINLYDQGLNGILADDMGLGKTIQTIAFLAHLAEEKDIWGPFMVIAPVSTLHNWQQEITRFSPSLKAVPYWGTTAERKVIRQLWTPKNMYTRNAKLHVLVTSYQLVVQDEQYFKRVKWQYMVLDEAHALKSTRSLRWKTLLSFNCRNRLLLTGTPIQNNMAELWALLHFIMPSFFDSHDEFNEWFSKDIEQHAEGASNALNEQQVSRLHQILKPFMLRRVKMEVINEMADKEEIEVPCSLTTRQRRFYDAIKSRISISDLLQNTSEVLHLMNLVMQFRKVCNHPELFERRGVRSPFQMITTAPFRHNDDKDNAVNENPICITLPRLLAGLREELQLAPELLTMFSPFVPSEVHASLFHCTESTENGVEKGVSSSAFSYSRFADLSVGQLCWLLAGDALDRFHGTTVMAEQIEVALLARLTDSQLPLLDRVAVRIREQESPLVARSSGGSVLDRLRNVVALDNDCLGSGQPLVRAVKTTYCTSAGAAAAPPQLLCSDRRFATLEVQEQHSGRVKKWLLGEEFIDCSLAGEANVYRSGPAPFGEERVPTVAGISKVYETVGSSEISVPGFGNLLRDSGKMQTLDRLLYKLKAEDKDHRVLVYSQMTKMIDLLEDFMIFRGYKYLRLDGQSKLSDRRDMVDDFQNSNEVFVFLLSTRAGGLGINLTAADTVIFYDSDWNPTMDAQAMDRAHRLGQTRKVTVYRLVCNGTVEEKILKRAQQKHMIQNIVIAGGKFQTDGFRDSQEVVSLLLNDAEVESSLIQEVQGRQQARNKKRKGRAGFV